MPNNEDCLKIIKNLLTRVESGELKLEGIQHQAGTVDITPEDAKSHHVAHTGEEFYMIWARRPGSYLNKLRRTP